MHVGWRVIILRRYLITHASSKDLCNFIESLTLKYFTLTVTVKLSTNITWSDVLFFLNKVSRPFSLKGNVTMLQLLLNFPFDCSLALFLVGQRGSWRITRYWVSISRVKCCLMVTRYGRNENFRYIYFKFRRVRIPKKTLLRNETTRLFKPGDLVCQVLLSFPCFGSNIQTSEQSGISKNSTTTHQSFKPPRNFF